MSAHAQTLSGFDMNRFDQAPAGSEWFSADSLDLRGKARPAVRAILDYGHEPQHARVGDTYVVSHQLVAHLAGSFVLFDRVRLGLGLPVMLSQSGESKIPTVGAASGASAGDLRISADVRLFGRYGDPFTVAFGGQVWAPTGDAAKYTGDGKVRLSPRVKAAGVISGFEYSAQLGYMYRAINGTYLSTSIGDELQYSAALGTRVLGKKLLLGPEVLGSWVLEPNKGLISRAYAVSALASAHYTAGDFKFGLGAGPGLSYAAGTPLFRVLASLEWAPEYTEPKKAPADRDGDGIEDAKDACPDLAGVATNNPKTNGCPADADQDGIADKVDACPDKPGPKSDDPAKNGCPVPLDSDGDGVLDKDDACVSEAGDKTSDPKTNGCPGDKDKDGVYDKVDACPDVPGLKTADPKTNGCPGDKDNDSIRDDQDACPTEPGKPNTDPKKNGCPDVFISAGQVMILDQIKFKTGSAVILAESQPIIDAVAKVLKAHPEIKKLRVEGHTDNVGKPAMNKDLSRKRAAAVMAALVKAGIEKARLTSNGFGQEVPLSSNDTETGRANNRRVEFHIEDAKK